jgi:hypothetical protein
MGSGGQGVLGRGFRQLAEVARMWKRGERLRLGDGGYAEVAGARRSSSLTLRVTIRNVPIQARPVTRQPQRA